MYSHCCDYIYLQSTIKIKPVLRVIEFRQMLMQWIREKIWRDKKGLRRGKRVCNCMKCWFDLYVKVI